MTKRLEEILKESPFNQHTEEFLIKLEDMNEITKIVQELEELNRILSSDKSMFIEELVREQQQNKRYREVIKKAIDDLENECLWDALVKLKALEGDLEWRKK